jgi:ABC-type branched-subunit amino acid transport system permease subunit
VSVVVLGPVVGYVFDRFLFRYIPNSNGTAKLVCSLALLVGIPELLPVIFGPQNLDATTTIFPFFNPNVVYFTIGSGTYGTPINGIYLATISVTVVVLVLLTILLRFTSLGLQMRGAVESRRLVQLDGINANGVVGLAWIVSSFMAALAGVLLAPVYGSFNSDEFVTLTVTAIAAAAWALLRSLPIAAGVAVLIGVATTVLQGYIPPNSFWNAAVVPSIPFFAIAAALLILPGMRNLDASRDPLATIDPPPVPIAASARAPSMDRIIRTLWWVLLAAFCVSMLTWIPITWEGVFNDGLTLSIILLSITLITGMAGQLSLCQATFAGIGGFTAAVFSVHLGLNFLLGGLIGCVLAAVVAVALALLSLRLRGLGLALMTLAAALLFDNTAFNDIWVTGGQQGTSLQSKWLGTSAFFNFNGHAMFILVMVVLIIAVVVVLQVRKGTVGRNLAAMRGSETATAGLGVNLAKQRIVVFALSGAIAGVGGVLFSIQQQHVSPVDWNTTFSLVFVVIVVTTSVNTVEGAIQAGIGYYVIQQIFTYLPARLGGPSLTIVLFAFGALTYAQHPEGVLEFQKRKSTMRFERLFFAREAEAEDLKARAVSAGANG